MEDTFEADAALIANEIKNSDPNDEPTAEFKDAVIRVAISLVSDFRSIAASLRTMAGVGLFTGGVVSHYDAESSLPRRSYAQPRAEPRSFAGNMAKLKTMNLREALIDVKTTHGVDAARKIILATGAPDLTALVTRPHLHDKAWSLIEKLVNAPLPEDIASGDKEPDPQGEDKEPDAQ